MILQFSRIDYLMTTLTIPSELNTDVSASVLRSVVAVGTHEAVLRYLGSVSPNMPRVLASAGVAGMQGAVSSPLVVAPGVTGGFTGTPAGAGGLALLVLCITKLVRTQRLSLCDEVWADPVTGFPSLNTVLPAHVESKILYAEVRTGDGGGAVIIAEAILSPDETTRTVHLGAA